MPNGDIYCKMPSIHLVRNKCPPLDFVAFGKYSKDISLHVVDLKSTNLPVLRNYLQVLSGHLLRIFTVRVFGDEQDGILLSVKGVVKQFF